ncbi:MAG: CocE/NonD family hydrolase [Acidobacteriota bacterium]
MTRIQRLQRILPRQIVPTRDRVELCTDVYLTQYEEAVPTVVIRTPYGRNLPLLMQIALRFSAAGMAVVLQDCRGRYQSGGTYDWQREEDDTYDTLAWIAEQPWADGRVGLYGMSITAHPNFLVSVSGPPEGIEIAAMVSVMGTVSHYDTFYRDGALVLHWALPWFTMADEQERGRSTWQELPWHDKLRQLPLESMSTGTESGAEIWSRMLAHPQQGPMWRELDANHRIGGLAVPTLFLSGWSDFLIGQAVEGYQVASEGAPVDHRMVVGPWDHKTIFNSFGAAAEKFKTDVDLLGVIVDWFTDRLIVDGARAAGSGIRVASGAERTRVQLYLENGDGWLGSPTFPLPGTDVRSYYLSSGGGANTRDGDGELRETPPANLGRDTFTYDPDDPVPTRGGAVWPFPAADLQAGPADQSDIEDRQDVLVYVSEPLEDDLDVVGPIEVEVWVSTSAQDTDFTAKLVEVDAFGVPEIVQDGIVRGRFHASLEEPEHLQPHKPYKMRIPMQSICRRFQQGHQIGLEVSSSCFPKFDRHLNTSGDWIKASVGMVAQQTVFHGGAMASRLLLPVVPADRVEEHRIPPSTVASGASS